MSSFVNDRVPHIIDDSSCVWPGPRNQKLPIYDGHCAACDEGRHSAVFLRDRRQGYGVPADVVVPSRPCDDKYDHNRVCGACYHLWQRGRLPAPTTKVRRAVMRDGADVVPESAASALLDLSSRAPMDLDLPASMGLGLPTSVAASDVTDADVAMDVAMNTDETLTPQHKRQRRSARVVVVQGWSDGTRKKCARALVDEYTHEEDGVNITVLPNEHGQPLNLMAIVQPRKGNDDVCNRTKQMRAANIKTYRSLSVSMTNADEDIKNKNEIASIQNEMKQSPEQFQQAINNCGLFVEHKLASLSANETLALKTVANLTFRTVRKMHSFFRERGIKVFASEQAVRSEIKQIVHKTETGSGVNNSVTKKKDKKKRQIRFIRYENIAEVLNEHIKPLIEQGNPYRHDILRPKQIQLAVMGDKGGNYVKLGVSIINRENPQSPHSIIPLCMYMNGDEDYQLINEYMSKTIKDIEEWATSVPELYPKWKADLLLGGDTHWLWVIMGLAKKGTHYCPFCKCNNNVKGGKHNAFTIKFPCRTHKDHCTNVGKFNCDHPNITDLRGIQSKSAAAFNCIRLPLTGRQLYENLIPPLLHIDNGVCKIMMDECQKLNREKDMQVRIANNGDEEQKIRNAVALYNSSSAKTNELEAELHTLIAQRQQAIKGTKKSFDGIIQETKKSLTAVKKEAKSSSTIILACEGEYIKEYNVLIDGILVQNRHSVGLRGALVGSVVNRMFDVENFIPALEQVLVNGANDEMKERAVNIIKFMTEYAGLRPYLKGLHRLSDACLQEIDTKCGWLGEHFPLMFPHRIISPKLHMLFIHVPKFARKHRNLGLYSESGFESMHAEFNLYDRTFVGVTKEVDILRLNMVQAELKRSPKLNKQNFEKRKCACGGAIAKSTPDKERCKCKVRTRKESDQSRKRKHS